MLMKKFKRIAILIASIFCLFLPSCKDIQPIGNKEYKLDITGHAEFIIEGPHRKDSKKTLKSFKAGDIVVFYTAVVYDAEITFSLNGHKMEEAPNDEDNYNFHSFVMPAQNSVLNIGLVGGFYSLDHAPLFHYYDWIKYLSEEEIAFAIYYDPCKGIPNLSNFNKYYSASKEEIHDLYTYLNNTYVEKVDYHLVEPGSVYNTIHIETIYGDEYDITANNNYINVSSDTNYSYRLSNPLPTFEELVGNTLNDQATEGIIVTNDTKDVTSSFNLNRLKLMQFTVEEGVEFPAVMNDYNRYIFENSWGKIIFQSSTCFVVYDTQLGTSTCCNIINGLTFEQLKK